MTTFALRAAALLSCVLTLAACVSQGPFPSLKPRDIEQERPAVPEPVPDTPDDPALTARAAQLVELARAGDRDFTAIYPDARAAAAAAGDPESESWVIAQQWLSALEAARVETMRALAELDRIAVDRAGTLVSEGDFRAVMAALGEAERIAASQQRRMDEVGAAITL